MSEERESLRLVAYNYEPEYTEEEMQNMTTKTPVNNELRKNVCAVVRRNMSNSIDELECIPEHPQFQLLILNPDVLTVAFIQIMMYKRQPGRAPDNLTNV